MEDPRMPEVVTISHPKGYRWQKRYPKMFATQKNCLLREMADINSVPVDRTSQNPLTRRNPCLPTDPPPTPPLNERRHDKCTIPSTPSRPTGFTPPAHRSQRQPTQYISLFRHSQFPPPIPRQRRKTPQVLEEPGAPITHRTADSP